MLDRLSTGLTLLYLLDRLLKLLAVWRFFRRPAPPAPAIWPAVSLLQPITRGASGLDDALRARAALDYPAPIQHLLICDQGDALSQATARAWLPRLGPHARLALAAPDGPAIASKIAKLQAGQAHAHGEVLVFIDDDVAPRPDALCQLVTYLAQPDAGAVFGLACYTAWDGVWSSLMSLFVNANALTSYIPLTYLSEPYTVTGHLFALRRPVFDAIGGLDGLAGRIDDDHEVARRVRRCGLRCVQTPVVYDVRNDLPSARAYAVQMRRWFVLPRQTMAPWLTRREQAVSLLGSVGLLLPGLVALLALVGRSRAAWRNLAVCLASFGLVYHLGEAWLGRRTPLRRWPLLPLVALVTPFQIMAAWLGGDEIEWRGQRLRVRRGGQFEVQEETGV